MAPPSTYLAMDQGYKVFGRGRDYTRFLQTGVVASDTYIKQKRERLVRFLRAWNRAWNFLPGQPRSHASLHSKETRCERPAIGAQNV